MLATFDNLGIEISGVSVGRFSGVAEISIHEDSAQIERIMLDPTTEGFTPMLLLTRREDMNYSTVMFNLLSAAIIQRHAAALMSEVAIRRSDRAKVVS